MSNQWAEARARRALAEAGLDYSMPLERAEQRHQRGVDRRRTT